MDTKLLNKIRIFCKTNKIAGFQIRELYNKFLSFSRDITITQSQFEQGFQILNKTIIRKLRKNCIQFYKDWKKEKPYEAFITNREYITRDFWNSLVDVKSKPIPQPVDETFEEIKDQLAQKPETVGLSDHKSPDEKKTAESKFTKTVVKVPVPSSSWYVSNKQKLPPNWDKMTLTKRMEFASKIKNDDEFKAYVMALDPRIEKYANEQAARASKNTVRLYVTLFSFPADKTSPESKNLIKKFVNALNQFGKGRLQYVETVSPSMVEIREVRS